MTCPSNNKGAEQSLEPYETCCLAEVFLPNIESKTELIDICTKLYRICKHSLTLSCHQPETDEVVHKNMRMGIGMTGVLQATEEQLGWLNETYRHLRLYDEKYSRKHKFSPSIKLTTIKPSGTLSLLPGVTPGIHPGYAQYMIRRITIDSNHPLIEVCREHGYPMDYKFNLDGTYDYNSIVVDFPFSYPEGTKLAKDMSAIDQLKWIKRLQTIWSDNSVSCTVYYRKEELESIKKFLTKEYKNNFKSLSFLLHSEHGFKQAPYEEINEYTFQELQSKTRLITSVDQAVFEGGDECAGGMCPVK